MAPGKHSDLRRLLADKALAAKVSPPRSKLGKHSHDNGVELDAEASERSPKRARKPKPYHPDSHIGLAFPDSILPPGERPIAYLPSLEEAHAILKAFDLEHSSRARQNTMIIYVEHKQVDGSMQRGYHVAVHNSHHAAGRSTSRMECVKRLRLNFDVANRRLPALAKRVVAGLRGYKGYSASQEDLVEMIERFQTYRKRRFALLKEYQICCATSEVVAEAIKDTPEESMARRVKGSVNGDSIELAARGVLPMFDR